MIGSSNDTEKLIPYIKNIGYKTVLEYEFEFFDIESARELTNQLSQKSDGTTCLIYTIHRTNLEAQNTLLKSLEEYGSNVALILHIPHENTFLPTIHSRCHRIDLRTHHLTSQVPSSFDWITWLDGSPVERMEALRETELSNLREGVDILERYFYTQFLADHRKAHKLSALQKVRSWINSSNPSTNMIGEFLSLTL
ncbi:hypothetical protein H6776_02430 [Candidatus Nomurabacteria bacterium]|nr:hypothetical protein [Candidatus Nomurabacteria bacterium]